MKLIRQDLIIQPSKDHKILLTHSSTQEQYTFSHEEAFILNEIKKPYNIKVILVKLNAKFRENKTAEYISNFIDRLDELGLLEDHNQDDGEKSEGIIQAPSGTPAPKNLHRLNHWSLFSPQKILDRIVQFFSFFRFFNWILVLFMLLAFSTLFFNLHLYEQDIANIKDRMPWIKHLAFTLITVNFFSQLLKGCVARYYSINTPSFGILLAYGFIPRLDIAVEITPETSKEAKLWLTASAIISRMILCNVGIMVWFVTREMGTSLSFFGSALAMYSFFSILENINPLMSGDGYRFITLYYGIPNIRERAVRCLKNQLFSTPEVIARYSEDRFSLKIYGSLSLLFIIAAIIYVIYIMGNWLKDNYQGLGVVVMSLIIMYEVLRFRYLLRAEKELSVGLPPSGNPFEAIGNFFNNSIRKAKGSDIGSIRKIHWVRMFFIALFIVALFLPYQYEAVGSAVVKPVNHQKIYSERIGIINKVYYNGGEWLKKNTLIADMDNYQQQRDVLLTRAKIEKKKQDIEVLLTTPTKEAIELASQQLITSKLLSAQSVDDYKRAEVLYKDGLYSYVEYLTAKNKMDLDKQTVQEKEANLRAVENQVNVHTIEATKIELEILKKDLLFYEDELERTKLRMPNDGKIITMNLKNLEREYLEEGKLFAEIEDSRHVQIEIQLPELDIGQVSIGNPITFKFKAHLYPDEIIMNGRITSIYPAVTVATSGTTTSNMLTVVGIVPNENFFLKSDMTGYAKIEGKKMMVIQAFTKSLVSYFQIELWSWFP